MKPLLTANSKVARYVPDKLDCYKYSEKIKLCIRVSPQKTGQAYIPAVKRKFTFTAFSGFQ